MIKVITKIITSVGESVKKSEPSYTAGKNVDVTTTLEDSLAVPQKMKHYSYHMIPGGLQT